MLKHNLNCIFVENYNAVTFFLFQNVCNLFKMHFSFQQTAILFKVIFSKKQKNLQFLLKRSFLFTAFQTIQGMVPKNSVRMKNKKANSLETKLKQLVQDTAKNLLKTIVNVCY